MCYVYLIIYILLLFFLSLLLSIYVSSTSYRLNYSW